MDRFQALQVFVKVAECGGFAAAARDLAMSPPAVTRAVSALESRIGIRLLVRTTRSVRLTESGKRFLLDCRRILVDLEEAEEAAVGSHAAPRGELCITAPVLFGRQFITPILGDFLDTLDERKRQVFVLSEVGQLAAPEIAEILGVPQNTVYSRLRSARHGFSEHIERQRSRPRRVHHDG